MGTDAAIKSAVIQQVTDKRESVTLLFLYESNLYKHDLDQCFIRLLHQDPAS